MCFVLDSVKKDMEKKQGIRQVILYTLIAASAGIIQAGSFTLFEEVLHSEIERIELFDELPTNWTYPQIQPLLLEKAMRII